MNTSCPSVLVFASGTERGGGTGFLNLVKKCRSGMLEARIVGASSPFPRGGVRGKADECGISFHHWYPESGQDYRAILEGVQPEFVVFCGWERPVYDLPEGRTIVICRGQEGYHDEHKRATRALLKRNDAIGYVTFRFARAGDLKGPCIIQIPFRINLSGVNLAESLNEKMLREHVRRAYREAQNHFADQVLNHVFARRVVLNADYSVTVPDLFEWTLRSIKTELKIEHSCT